ncbi:M60 family metallopeptidase [Paenibacillus flagellatus]|nr:M60 family metallopeptidase [Paenibacillus flagellatus]
MKQWYAKFTTMVCISALTASLFSLPAFAAGDRSGSLQSDTVTASAYGSVTQATYGPTLTPPDVLQQDFDILYRDLSGIPTFKSLYTGGVLAIGESAFPIAAHPKRSPMIAASRYGQGRIVVAGNENYFNLGKTYSDGRSTLARNMLLWLTDESHTNNGLGNDKTNRYEDALAGSGKKIRLATTKSYYTVDPSLPIEVVKLGSWTDTALKPQKIAVAHVDWRMTDDEMEALDQYVREGGAVVVALQGWTLDYGKPTKLNNDFALQKFLNRAGIALSTGIAASEDSIVPATPFDKANHYHSLRMIDQAKALENGTITADQLEIGAPGADAGAKLAQLTQIVGETISSITSAAPLYETMRNEMAAVQQTTPLPINKSALLYRSILLNYVFSTASLEPNGTVSPYHAVWPGAVANDAPTVNDRDIEVNFDYFKPDYLRAHVPVQWTSTGLYAPAGGVVTLEVPEGTTDLEVQVGAHTDNLMSKTTWERAPIIAHKQKLVPGLNRIGSPYGGLIYLIPTKIKENTKVTVTISGAVEAPFYDLGKTTPEQWEAIRHAPAPFAELQSNRIVLTVPSSAIRNLDNPEQLMRRWDTIVEHYDELIGLGPDKPVPHTGHELRYRYVVDKQISAGYMHAGTPIMMHNDSYVQRMLDANEIFTTVWGLWHELGHNYQQSPWTWNGIGEATCNLFGMYMLERYTGKSLQKSDYDKAFEWLNSTAANKSYSHSVPGNMVFWKQLQMAYGWDLYTKLFTYYRDMPAGQLPGSDQQKIDTFVLTASKLAGENLLEFFDKWALKYSPEARVGVEALNLPAPQHPIWKLTEFPTEPERPNLALGKPADQSSTAYEGIASRAVDGITSGAWSGNSVTHTNVESQPWWQVDLGESKAIGEIAIWNRTDSCCKSRLTNYYVFVSDLPFASHSLAGTLAQPGVWSSLQTETAGSPTKVSVGKTGRYVKIQLTGRNALNLAEVQVIPNE